LEAGSGKIHTASAHNFAVDLNRKEFEANGSSSEPILEVIDNIMGKRGCTSNPAVIVELADEEDAALRYSKRRALQFASNTVAMTLLALRTSKEASFPLDEAPFPLQLKRQAQAVNYSVSSITDDEDENEKNEVVASKKRSDVLNGGHPLTLALRKPTLYVVDTRRHKSPLARLIPLAPFGRPLPPAPLLPSLLLSPGVIPSTNKSYMEPAANACI
jgi:hypothetical protein